MNFCWTNYTWLQHDCPRLKYLTLGVHGNPLAGTGVEGRGGVGGRSSSLPLFSSSAVMSSTSLPLSNGSSRLLCFTRLYWVSSMPGRRDEWRVTHTQPHIARGIRVNRSPVWVGTVERALISANITINHAMYMVYIIFFYAPILNTVWL